AEIIGTIQLGSRTPREFKPEEVHLFEAIGHQLGIAVQKTKLYEANQQALKEIEALYAVTTTATQSLTLNTVLQEVIRKVTDIFAFDTTRIFLLDSSMQTLVLEASYEISPEKYSGVRSFRRGQGVVGRAAESPEPIIFEDIRSDPKYSAMSHSGNARTVGFRFFAVFPITRKDQTIGVVTFSQNDPRSLSSGEIKLLAAMAAQIAVAVENASLYEEITKRANDLQKKTWELEKANRAKDEFLAMISHELRTPLNVMMGYTGLLREGMFGALNPQQDDALKKVAIQSNDLLSIVSNLVRTTQIGSGEIKAERARTDLGQLLDEIKTAYDLPLNNGLTLNWDFPSDLPTVETDSEKLKHTLVNLINNAIKFTEKGSVTIAARHLPKSKTLRFTVADTGVGISRESLPLIFDMFHQLDSSNTRAHGGLGLGLYIVKKYTELLGGKIKVKCALGRGSVFRVALPYESSLCHESTLPAVTPESRIVDPWMTES
ncbi:MAG: ATP-binding protein, partial [Candidatus Omnitrophota bacterium]|nr:ATP-binding protein [Candidatus Omnitrophota bacterium]